MLISYKVTVVYPIAAVKHICWIDPGRGEVVSRKKSPKKGCIYDSLKELYYIRDMLGDPNLTVRLLLLEIDEYKLLDGWGKDRKNRATKYEKIPLRLISETDLCEKRDYMMLLPPCLPDRFTVKEFAGALHMRSKAAYAAVKVFTETGCIIHDGSVGRAAAYRIADDTDRA